MALRWLFGGLAAGISPLSLLCPDLFLLSNAIISASFYNPDTNDFDINDDLDRFDIIKNTR